MTISRFENETSNPIPATLTAIQRALEEAGVTFIDEDAEGPGVRLRKGDIAAPTPPFPIFRPELPFGPGRFGVWVPPGSMAQVRRVVLIQMAATPQVPRDAALEFWTDIMSVPETLKAILNGALSVAKGLRRVTTPADVTWYFWQPEAVFPNAPHVFGELDLDDSDGGPTLLFIDTLHVFRYRAIIQDPSINLDWSLFDEPVNADQS